MPIQLKEENGGKLINVHVSGKLEKADYEHFVPEFERLARQHGKIASALRYDRLPWLGGECGLGRFQVRDETHVRHRSNCDGRGKAVAARHGDLLKAVHQGRGPLLRSRRDR